MSEEKKRINASEAWREAKTLVSSHKQRLALGGLLMIISRTVGLVMPASSKFLIDDVILNKRTELLVPIVLAGGIATIIQAGTSFLLTQILGVAAQRAITDMRRRVMTHVEHLPVRYYDSTQTGKLISRIMNDAEGIRNLVGSGLVQLTGSIITALFAMTVLFYLNWKMTAITLIVLATFGGGLSYAFKVLRPLFRKRSEIYSEITGRLGESLGGIRIVKAYTAEKREELIFTKGVHDLFRNVRKTMVGVSAITAFSSTIVGSIGVIIMLVGGKAVLAGQMTFGDLITYILFTGLMAMPIIEISSIGTQITEAFAGLDRIRELLSMKTEDEDDSSKASLKHLAGDIEFQNVSFEYNDDTPVLKHVSFVALPGSTTALVGSSGSGKSTLIGLAMNFNKPLSGKILIDGRDLAEIKMKDYRSYLGVVLQENFLFDGTVADNIKFSHPHATLDEIKEVSRIAHCNEFIESFENQYDTIVGERGVKLSGGQRQRIAIARALLADPKILILDEATSSLDSESEAMIQEGLRTLRRGRTTFVIAHRLSTIRSADQILVLENGEIVERGTHHQLLEFDGRYKQLYDKQYKFERDQFINPGEDFTKEDSSQEHKEDTKTQRDMIKELI